MACGILVRGETQNFAVICERIKDRREAKREKSCSVSVNKDKKFEVRQASNGFS